MLFNSIHFLIFFPIVVCVYFLIPSRIKYIWLLIASYYFYMCWNPKYIVLIGISTIVTYVSGLLIEKFTMRKRWIVAGSFITNLGILAFFKYFNFIYINVEQVLHHCGITIPSSHYDIILPVGISFYTFQALSYTVDVYRGEIKAEHNILKYALFVSFFPQLVAGPIERSKNLLQDIQDIPKKKMLDYNRITSGLTIMLYGMFLKLVIADRISIVVDTVFDQYKKYDSIALLIAAVCFSIQIYCDFSSYSTIAIGAARVMGFTLMENFDTPYFATSIKDFWRRWHISLSTWFRDYLYIPLGGNRCSKARKYFNLLVTFAASGLWHGAGWSYIVWGMLHGIYQIIGELLVPVKNWICKICKVKKETFSYKLMQMLITFFLVTFAWIFFRADSFRTALGFIYRMLTAWSFNTLISEGFLKMGLSFLEWNILLVALAFMFGISLIKYRRQMTIDTFLAEQNRWFRWSVLYLLLFAILIYGKYGPAYDQQAFIYFQF